METLTEKMKNLENEVSKLMTPADWWEAAPWQDIDENTPRKQLILAMDKNNKMSFILLTMSSAEWIKWLPLPEESQ